MSDRMIVDKINMFYGTIVAILSYVLGEHWFLFVAFLVLNVIDYITGCLKSRINKKTNSAKGAIGILKKIGYWLMIVVAFSMSAILIELGSSIGVNLECMSMIGYMTLAALIINELRSILENFVEAGYNVPSILVKGLEVANKAIDGMIKIGDDGIETILNKSDPDIPANGKLTLQVEDNRSKSSGGTPCCKG